MYHSVDSAQSREFESCVLFQLRRSRSPALSSSLTFTPHRRPWPCRTPRARCRAAASRRRLAGQGRRRRSRQGRQGRRLQARAAGRRVELNNGPAAIYWNPANKGTGDFTVSATFTEPKYMSSNDHPHPYGLFIGGNKLDTDQASFALLHALRQRHLHRPRLRPGARSGWTAAAAARRATRSTRRSRAAA